MTNIGRVGIVLRGNYNSASTYETLDTVSYQNGLYVAKQNVPAGIVPTNTTYWQNAVDGELVNVPTRILITENFTASDSLSYTGVNFTIPANKCFCVDVCAVFANSIPQEILVSQNSATDAPHLTWARSTTQMNVPLCGYSSEQITFYVSARYASAAINKILVRGWYLPYKEA